MRRRADAEDEAAAALDRLLARGRQRPAGDSGAPERAVLRRGSELDRGHGLPALVQQRAGEDLQLFALRRRCARFRALSSPRRASSSWDSVSLVPPPPGSSPPPVASPPPPTTSRALPVSCSASSPPLLTAARAFSGSFSGSFSAALPAPCAASFSRGTTVFSTKPGPFFAT